MVKTCCGRTKLTDKAHLELATVLQAYRGMVEAFKEASGLSEDAILDLRGNHDAFDVPKRWAIALPPYLTTKSVLSVSL